METVKVKTRRDDAETPLQSNRLKYQQVKNYVLQQIEDGYLKPGDALPPERTLAKTLGWGVHTIRHALSELKREEIVHRVQGKGTFIKRQRQTSKRKKLDIFALVLPETRGGFYPSLLHGFEDAAGEFHHQSLVCSTDNKVSRQAEIVLQLIDKQVGGVAIVPTDPLPPAYQIRPLQERGIPVVFCHRCVEGVVAPLLAMPYRERERLAGKIIAEHGHRRVVVMTYQPTVRTPEHQEWFQEGLRAGGCDVPAHMAHTGGDSVTVTEQEVWAVLQEMFSKPNPPTAIYATFDSLAETIYLLMPKLGLRVPEDVSLVGFGGSWRDGTLAQRLTSVVVDEMATGRKAVELLGEMRRGERALNDNEEFVMELSLSDGETLAAPAGVMA